MDLSALGISHEFLAAFLQVVMIDLTLAGDNAIAIGFAHLSETPTPPAQLRKDLPASLDAAILAALAKVPDERPASAKAFLDKAFG